MNQTSQPMSRALRPLAGQDTDGTETAKTRPRFSSESLFANSNTVVIRHGQADYLLRITSQNKLILTK